MKNVLDVLELFEKEIEDAAPLIAIRQSKLGPDKRARIALRAEEETLVRIRINAACAQFSRDLKWSRANEADAIFIYDRLNMAKDYGYWMLDRMPLPSDDLGPQGIILSLLVLWWEEYGVYKWRAYAEGTAELPNWAE